MRNIQKAGFSLASILLKISSQVLRIMGIRVVSFILYVKDSGCLGFGGLQGGGSRRMRSMRMWREKADAGYAWEVDGGGCRHAWNAEVFGHTQMCPNSWINKRCEM
jgi:hypothetical protein